MHITVYVYRMQLFACVSEMETGCIWCISYKRLNTRNNAPMIVCPFFIHGNMQLPWVSDKHAWTLLLVSDTHACTLPLVSDTQTCVVRSPPNNSSKTCLCGRGWHYDRKADTSPVARWQKILQKKSKGDVKNLFWPRKIRHVTVVPLVYLRVLVYFFWARNLGKTWQQW